MEKRDLIEGKLAYILIYHHKVWGKHKYITNLNYEKQNQIYNYRKCHFNKIPFKNDIRFFNLLWQCSPVWSTNTGILMTIIEKDVKLSHIKLKIEN